MCLGSSGSGAEGFPWFTEQNLHARVHVSPRIMNVAVRFRQHSHLFGHFAPSQTVWRPPPRRSRLISIRLSPPSNGVFSHGGRCPYVPSRESDSWERPRSSARRLRMNSRSMGASSSASHRDGGNHCAFCPSCGTASASAGAMHSMKCSVICVPSSRLPCSVPTGLGVSTSSASSSRSSRRMHSSRPSPSRRLPPGNSQSPPKERPSGRVANSNLPPRKTTAAHTSREYIG